MNPKVSVLMSAYNDERYVLESIESILKQDFDDFEMLVVDDGSTDATFSLISKIDNPKLVVSTQKNQGKAKTINKLIDMARGDYILIQDSDDVSESSRLKEIVSAFKVSPDVALILSGHSLILNGKNVAPKSKTLSPEACKKMVENYMLPAHDPTMMVRTDVAKALRFDSELRIGQGVDFIFRVAEKYQIRALGKSLYRYRFNTESVTKSDPRKKANNLLMVMNKARKRRGEPAITLEEFLVVNSRWANDKYNNISGHFMESAYLSVMDQNRMEALKTALASLRFLPNGLKYAFPFLYAISPKSLCEWGKSRFGSG